MVTMAQNPIIRDQFSADPTARVFNNKVYLYPSHDIKAPEGQRKDWFCMEDYHVFSSDNLVDWTDHGCIISQNNVPWGKVDAYSMWAPDCVYKNGKYYFYFPNAPQSGRGFAIGVATSDNPAGPFTCEPGPIKGVSGIDPCVLVDNDGSAYIYWSGMGIRGAKLKDNMVELDGELQEVKMPHREGMAEMPPIKVGGQVMEGLPEGFKEGPFAFKRGDWYYLTFPWVRGDTSDGKNPTETLAYSMSKSPLGPWVFKGIIMAEHSNHCWTNHHSLVEYQGQWYLFYHHNDFSPSDDKRRSVCVDRVKFNSDGTIQQVYPTKRGVGIIPATNRIEVEGYSNCSEGVSTALLDTVYNFKGISVTLPKAKSSVEVSDIDFSMLNDAYVIAKVRANKNTKLSLREKNNRGKEIASITITVTGENGPFRRNLSGQWLTLTAPLSYAPKGISTLCATSEGDSVDIDWVQFKNHPRYFSPAGSIASASKPDSAGFIRRWLLLEPISKPNRSNNVFTDTYLREHFYMSYFKDQMTTLPKDGQKVKAGKQTLTWRALDSENFNVKLFRFAEKWGQQTYGSLFWGVTYIDCPEDIENVRLAAGSNGASIWWVNGKEVLLLSGDRRMVEDDGMSGLLTLHKGRNVIRCSVINGPGLSDFCVRFIDENGKPVTNYTITTK